MQHTKQTSLATTSTQTRSSSIVTQQSSQAHTSSKQKSLASADDKTET